MQALLIFIVALAVRLLHVWQIKGTPFFDVLLGDAHGYDLWAQRLAAGDWVGTDVFYQAPLYPYFLGVVYAIAGHDLLIVRLVQAVIGSASCVLLGMAGARLFSKRVGLIAGLALALWAPAIFFDALLQKSVLDMFFVCLSLWLISGIGDQASGIGRCVALGAAMGALALTRENALLLIAIVMIWILWRATERRLKPPLSGELFAFVAGLVLVFAPVVARNYSIDHRLYLTTSQFGSNFYIGNNANADGTYASIRFGRGAPEFERLDAKEVAEETVGHPLSPAEVSSFWFGKSMDFIAGNPARWLKLEGRKILLLFNRSEMIDTEAQESYEEISTPLRVLSWGTHFGILVPLAIVGMIAAWPDRRRLWILYALTVSYAASVVMFFVFARYRYPLVPFLLLFAVSGALALPHLLRARRWMAVGVAAAAAVFANVHVLDATLMQSITENNLGTALLDQKRYDEAIEHHQRAIQLRPDYAPAYNNLGAALRASGRLDDAVASYRKALELKPDFASASYNLANAQLEQGKSADSADSFRRSLEANPGSVEAHNNLGIALANKGDIAGAIAEFRAALVIDEHSVHAHRNLGNMLFDLGQKTEGMAHLERAVEIAPNEPEAVYDLGTILLQAQLYPAAAARFEAALKIKPDWAEAHNNLGIALASQGRIADALTHFERAVALNPSLADARSNRDQARATLKR
jgi:tetratricopeptide (TPR) repeat protein